MFSSSPDSPRTIHPLPDELPDDSAFRRPRSRRLPLLVMGLVVPALFSTVALPAYAYRGDADAVTGAASTAALEAYKVAEAQSADVVGIAPAIADRDGYTAVSAAEMAAAAAAAAPRYRGPSVGDLLANPPYPNYDLNTIVSIAYQYLGSPYRFAGADPSGFDCSGFTQFVYAHVGVGLPHSSAAQGSMTAIDPAAALPGDIVVLDGGGHVGIYIGGGQMIHAPYEGTVVRVQAMWGSYWFVRPGV